MDKIDQTLSPDGLLTTTFTSELDGKRHVNYRQDLEPHVEHATALRNDDEYTRQGIKKGWLHAAHIPDIVIIELRQIGIDVFRAGAREIVAGMKRLSKDHLLTTRANV